MFKKTMKFEDLNGDEQVETFYFNYTKKEVMELIELKNLEAKLERLTKPIEETGLTQQENAQQAYDTFEDLILGAYGVKSDDNRIFRKSEEIRDDFAHHVAFVELIFEMLEDTTLVQEFIENCLPKKLLEAAKADMAADERKKISAEKITEMNNEAARLQADPATRIEPGTSEHLQPSPEIRALAESLIEERTQPKPVSELTEEDILNMPAEEFKNLDPRKLTPEQMQVAFRRKVS